MRTTFALALAYTLAGLVTHLILIGRDADLWSAVIVLAWPVFAALAILALIGGVLLALAGVAIIAALLSS